MSENAFSSYEVEDPAILPLLVQSGYLTIKGTTSKEVTINGETDTIVRYHLGYPNIEVKNSFNESLLAAFKSRRR